MEELWDFPRSHKSSAHGSIPGAPMVCHLNIATQLCVQDYAMNHHLQGGILVIS